MGANNRPVNMDVLERYFDYRAQGLSSKHACELVGISTVTAWRYEKRLREWVLDPAVFSHYYRYALEKFRDNPRNARADRTPPRRRRMINA